MDNINYILSLIDWNNTLDQQAAGIKIAESIKDIQAFIQPCTDSYNKNVWDNCALIISKRSDAELLPYLDKLFAWMQYMNWPGAFCILDRLRKYAKTPSYDSVLNACFGKAKAENDYVWWNNLQMLKGESCLNLSNQ